MARHGYHPSPCYQGIQFFARGADRGKMRKGEIEPMVTIPRKILKLISENVADEQGAIAAVVHYAKTGEVMAPGAADVEAALQSQNERVARENGVLRGQMEKLQAQVSELMAAKEPVGKTESLPDKKPTKKKVAKAS